MLNLVKIRRKLHSSAETGFDLRKTVKIVESELTKLGYTPTRCGKSGIVATVGSGGKCILLRADMDALNIKEETNLDFAAKNNMHACGHDMHTTMLLGAAEILKKEPVNGTVKLMFQPSEETLEGALDMINDGVLDGVDAAMMIHTMVGTPFETGTAVIAPNGVSSPAADYFEILVAGKGTHGASPNNGIDPLNVSAHIILALQSISARELSINEPAVLTVASLNTNSSYNAISDTAVMRGTMRAYDEKTRDFMKQRLTDICKKTASAFRAEADVIFKNSCPTLINDKTLCEKMYNSLKDISVISGSDLNSQIKSSGSEDFAYISHKVPSVMVALSAGNSKHPLHNPKVVFDEEALSYGAYIYAKFAVDFLKD